MNTSAASSTLADNSTRQTGGAHLRPPFQQILGLAPERLVIFAKLAKTA